MAGIHIRLIILMIIAPLMLLGKPHGHHVHKGKATFHEPKAGTLCIQNEEGTIIHWQGFSLGKGEKVKFIQPHRDSCVLNRVKGSEVSEILGKVKSNGAVFLINPHGVVIGCDAKIQTAGFIASTADFSDQDFLSRERWLFSNPGSGEITNLGQIECPEGDIYLIGKTVTNEGSLLGQTVGLLADQEVLICPKANQKVWIYPQEKRVDRLKDALEGDNPYELAINQKGMVKAITLEEREGEIYLVSAAGKVSAKGSVQAEGGKIYALGEQVLLGEGSVLDASGKEGGTILVGGDTEGANRAHTVSIDRGASLLADGNEGNGGRVVIWGEKSTHFFGEVSCQALGEKGDGGFVEVSSSGNDYLFKGKVSTLSKQGKIGHLSLDPVDIKIDDFGGSSAPSFPTTSPGTYVPEGMSSARLDIGDLSSALASNNVSIASTGSGSGDGDITFYQGFSWNANTTLEVTAYRSIEIHSGVNLNCSGGGGITLTAQGSSSSTYHGIRIDQATLSTTTGPISLTGTSGIGGGQNGIFISGGAGISTTRGSLTLEGISCASQSGKGVLITDANSSNHPSTIQTTDGAIYIKGQGGGGKDQYDSDGVRLQKGSRIESKGKGTITIEGEGSLDPNVREGDGVNFEGTIGKGDRPTLICHQGSVIIKGTGHGYDRAEGIVASEEALIQSTWDGPKGTGPDALKMYFQGRGSQTTSAVGSPGISFSGSSISVKTVSVDLTLDGTGGGVAEGVSNNGVELNGPEVSSTGAGVNAANITIKGQSISGKSGNQAVKIDLGGLGTQIPATVTAVDGNIEITGTAEGSADTNQGISVKAGGKITISGSGNMTLAGMGGNGTTDCQGIIVSATDSAIRTATGNLTITEAKGGGSGRGNNGLSVISQGEISTTTGALKVTQATAASGSGTCEGILVDGVSSSIFSTSGSIDLTGSGGGNGKQNRGIHVTNTGTITSSGSITLNGTGRGETETNQGILIDAGGKVTTQGNGALTLSGTGGSSGTTDNHGIEIDGTSGSLASTVNGALSIAGTGGGTEVTNHGLFLHSGAKVEVTGTGVVDLNGSGSPGGIGMCTGIYVTDPNTKIATSSGNLTINKAEGGGTGSGNNGLSVMAGGQISTQSGAIQFAESVAASGSTSGSGLCEGILIDGTNSAIISTSGPINLIGKGGKSGNENRGIHVTNAGKITSSGAVTLIGNGGGTKDTNQGMLVDAGGCVAAQGEGALVVTATGGSGTTNNYGIEIDGNHLSIVSTENGKLSLTGFGGGSGSVNHGLFLHSGAVVKANGTGSVIFKGTGAATGNGACGGIYFTDAGTEVSSTSGDIHITGSGAGKGDVCQGVAVCQGAIVATKGNLSVIGTGGGTGQVNQGIVVQNGGALMTSGSGALTLNGTGGILGTTENHGIECIGQESLISTVKGPLTLTGNAGGIETTNYGIFLSSGAEVSSTATGTAILIGKGSSTGTGNSEGIVLTDTGTKVGGVDGALTLTGIGNGSNEGNKGISILSGAQVISSGKGLLTLTGTGATTGSRQNHGVHLEGAGSMVTSATGDLKVMGVGSGSSDSNAGIYLSDGGEIQSTETAKITLSGTGGAISPNSFGVSVAKGSSIQSKNGAIQVTGNSLGQTHEGILIDDQSFIASINTADMKLVALSKTAIGVSDVIIQKGSYLSSATSGEITIESSRDVLLIGGNSAQTPAFISPQEGLVKIVTGRDLTLVGGSGNRSEAQIGHHGKETASATLEFIVGRDINLKGESTNSFALIGHGDPQQTNQSFSGNISLAQSFRDINLNGAHQKDAGDLGFAQVGHLDLSTSRIYVSGLRNINVNGGTAASTAYARIGHVHHAAQEKHLDPTKMVIIAGESINIRSSAGRAEIVNHHGPLTLVVDQLCFFEPLIGSGEFNLHSLIEASGELRIYTARRRQCSVNDTINGVLFSPGPYGIDSSTEQWGVYYPHGPYGDVPFCFYYKEPDVIPLPPPFFPSKVFFRNISANLTALPDLLPLITDDPFSLFEVREERTLPKNPHH